MLSNAEVRVIFSNFKLRVIDELAPLYTRAALLPAGKLSRLMTPVKSARDGILAGVRFFHERRGSETTDQVYRGL